MAGLEGLGGDTDKPGMFKDVSDAAKSFRALSDNLDKRTAEISAGLTRFSGSGLRDIQGLASDGKRTLAEIERVLRNLERNPQRVIFGGGARPPDYNGGR
jgi:phospholipid/cholesterol/gamma-HCH transport system substrate-binding protein